MAFNWDDHPTVKDSKAPPAKGSFDWDAHPDAPSAATTSSGPSSLEALGRGALQGATLGFSDEATGGIEALLDKIRGKNADKSLGELYQQHRDESRAANKAAEKAHGGFYTAGNLAGGLAPLLIPGVGEGGLAAQAAKLGGLSAVQGVGESKSSNPEDMVKDAILSGAVGAAGGAVGHGLGKLVGRGAEALGNKAGEVENRLAEAAGDKARQDAIARAESARGSLGAKAREATSLMRDVEMDATGRTGLVSPETAGQSLEALQTPHFQALAEEQAQKRLGRIPAIGDELDTARALHEAAQQDIPLAAIQGKSLDAAKERALTPLKAEGRRALLTAGGAALGSAISDDEHRGTGALAGAAFGAAGGAYRLNAIKRILKNPDVQRVGASAISRLASSAPEAFGKWAPVISRAAAEGPDSFAVQHAILAQTDPSYANHLRTLTASAGEEQ